MWVELAGALPLLIWIYLLLGRGGFWRITAAKPLPHGRGSDLVWPPVVAVIPARNEAAVVGRAVASLAKQDYPGEFHIVLVDDASSDGTADMARQAAPAEMLTVMVAAPLVAGWTGKLWAVSQGIAEAGGYAPEYLLLTDADIVHPPDGLERLVATASSSETPYDLVSWMVTLRCESLAERALMPAFVFFFFMLYPPSWIRSARHRIAGAAGGCMLVRRAALEEIGGIQAIRGELIDDCALARAIKHRKKERPGRILLELNPDAQSIREYATFSEVFHMISRTAFTELRHSVWLLAGTVVGISVTFILPLLTALFGSLLGLGAWLSLMLAYRPMLRFYKRSVLWAPLLPLVSLFYLGATLHSAWSWWRGNAGMWKGRAQAKLS